MKLTNKLLKVKKQCALLRCAALFLNHRVKRNRRPDSLCAFSQAGLEGGEVDK